MNVKIYPVFNNITIMIDIVMGIAVVIFKS